MIRLLRSQSEVFLEKNRDQWILLKDMIVKNKHRQLTDSQMFEFPKLYRQTCANLEEAKRRKLSPDLLEFLTELTARANRILYAAPVLRKKTFFDFIKNDYPLLMKKSWPVLGASFLLFFLPMFICAFLVTINPDVAGVILGSDTLVQYEEMHNAPHSSDGTPGISAVNVIWYINNNVSIAFITFASGVLFGCGTVFFLVYNGITMGTVISYLIAKGFGENIITFVTAHSAMELIGIVFAGAAGLKLASGIIRGIRINRSEILSAARVQVVFLLLSAALMIGIAAFIEGIISPRAVPMTLRIAIGASCLFILISYTLIIPLIRRQT